ncbi:MAG: 2OG-Fe(II) oxygenase superfamily protein [Bacteroidetes bacterium]|jgi:alkylated DNA repair dioxygenase AlkB|nr:2OG-Fe(II) oxygenase superfamily protein [Bacteroidota bacterium]
MVKTMNGILYIEDFVKDSLSLFEGLKTNVDWDERMSARKTASFGVAYNYSQISYPNKEMPEAIADLALQLEGTLHFLPNNCLINYYLDGQSKMGYHSDQTDILIENTGIAIISLGATRSLRFKNITDPERIEEFALPAGSLIYMTQDLQNEWLHSIPKADTDSGRMSLTFRRMKQE